MQLVMVKIYSLEPVLEVNNMEETLNYYTKALGFSIDWVWPENGPADHASVSFGEGHEGDDHKDHHVHIQLSLSDETPVKNSGWLYLRVDDDLDSLYEKMKSSGAEFYSEIGDRPWGMCEFDVKDNNGHRLRFAKPIPEHSN